MLQENPFSKSAPDSASTPSFTDQSLRALTETVETMARQVAELHSAVLAVITQVQSEGIGGLLGGNRAGGAPAMSALLAQAAADRARR